MRRAFGAEASTSAAPSHHGTAKVSKQCTRWCPAPGCDRGYGCEAGMPPLTHEGYRQIVCCVLEECAAIRAFEAGPPWPSELAVHRDAHGKIQRVMVLEWYTRGARVRFFGTRGSKASDEKREQPYEMVVRRTELRRICPALTHAELDYIAQRAGIVGSDYERRKQVVYEMAWVRREFFRLATRPKRSWTQRSAMQPAGHWGA